MGAALRKDDVHLAERRRSIGRQGTSGLDTINLGGRCRGHIRDITTDMGLRPQRDCRRRFVFAKHDNTWRQSSKEVISCDPKISQPTLFTLLIVTLV
jgi:hypothetical protein